MHGEIYTTTTTLPPRAPLLGTMSTLGQPISETTPYATCNGLPRYHGGWTSTAEIPLPTTTANQTFEILATATTAAFPNLEPTCCIGSESCLALQTDWHAVNPLLNPFNSSLGTGWLHGPPITYPHCNTTEMSILGPGNAGDCSGCYVFGGEARLYYWPAPVEEAPFCPSSYTLQDRTAPPDDVKGPVTAVITYSNANFYPNITTTATHTSPTIYMSIDELEGRDGCHFFYGGPIPGTVFPLGPKDLQTGIITVPGMTDAAASSSVASIIAHQETDKYTDLFGVGWQSYYPYIPVVTQLVDINIADFGRPPPYLSYYLGDAGAYCINTEINDNYPAGLPCNTIFDEYYLPNVQLGKLVRSMQSMWATCDLDFGWDPPFALTPQSSVASITLPIVGAATATSTVTVVPAEPFSIASSAVPCSTPRVSTATATAPLNTSPEHPTATQSPNTPSAEHSTPGQGAIPASQTAQSSVTFVVGTASLSAFQSGSIVQIVGPEDSIIATVTQDAAGTMIAVQMVSAGSLGLQVGSGIVLLTITSDGDAGVTHPTSGDQSFSIANVPKGSSVVVDGDRTIGQGSAATTLLNGQALTFASGGIVASSASDVLGAAPVVVDGSITLNQDGGPTTLANGQVLSLATDGIEIFFASSTDAAPISTVDPNDDSSWEGVHSLSVDGQMITFSAAATNLEVVDGITVTNEQAATTLMNGLVVSAGSGEVFIDTLTASIMASATTASQTPTS